jgi:hypothetical protein
MKDPRIKGLKFSLVQTTQDDAPEQVTCSRSRMSSEAIRGEFILQLFDPIKPFLGDFDKHLKITMKFAATILALIGSAAAFAPAQTSRASTSLQYAKEDLVGAIPPVGFFDPLGFADKADSPTLKRYREAELTHGRVAMLAVVGFLVGEAVEGSSFLFDASISGPAITHLSQVPAPFWVLLTIAIGASEQTRAVIGWVDPADAPVDKPGLLRDDYVPGDLGFDPLGLKPSDPEELITLQTKELQNGRLAMLAAAGFMAQELVNGKGILENLQG